MVTTGAKIFELDWQVDLEFAKKVFGNKAVLMGNIDPSDPLVWGTPEQVEAKAKEFIEKRFGKILLKSYQTFAI